MPMARKVADSRVRSITDRLSVFATPTKAMSTATAIKPTNNAIMPLIMVSHCVRSATGPVTVTPALAENTFCTLVNTSFNATPAPSASMRISMICPSALIPPLVKWLASTKATAA